MSTADLAYLAKTARALQLIPLVTVASAPMLVAVLEAVPGLRAIVLSGRNMRLWRVDPGKALALLRAPEVQAALAAYPVEEGRLAVVLEGFASPGELQAAWAAGRGAGGGARADGVLLGEELRAPAAKATGQAGGAAAVLGVGEYAAAVERWLGTGVDGR